MNRSDLLCFSLGRLPCDELESVLMSHITMRFLWYSLAVLLGSATGCNCRSELASTVKPNDIHQRFTIHFDGAANTTNVVARFVHGKGNHISITLDGAAKVTHNKFALSHAGFTGSHYTGSSAGYLADHTFRYTDINGKAYINSVHLPSVDFAADAPTTISRGKGVRIPFTASPIGERESVRFLYTQDGQRGELNLWSSRKDESSITLSTEDLRSLKDDPASIQLQRIGGADLKQATEKGGHATLQYETKPREVTIVP